MDIKILSSCQVCWAQKLSCYYFWIDYHQGKANETTNALSCFPQRILDKEEKLWAENNQIFYCLQILLTKANLAGLSFSGLSASSKLSPLYQVLICGTYGLPQLYHF